MYETIALTIDERGVATVKLDRLEKHNALNGTMIAELTDVAEKLDADPAVRAVVLRAEGKSFCAGGDLSWMQEQAQKDRAGKMAGSRALAAMLTRLNRLSKPLIARVQGHAYGGGVGILCVCDIAICAEGVRFVLSETKLGLIPATIGPFVVNRMGEGLARQVFFTSKPFSTELALRSGIISAVCPPEALDDEIEDVIGAILKCAPGAVASAKKLCLEVEDMNPATVAEETAALLADRWQTDEGREGIAAFFASRAPSWS